MIWHTYMTYSILSLETFAHAVNMNIQDCISEFPKMLFTQLIKSINGHFLCLISRNHYHYRTLYNKQNQIKKLLCFVYGTRGYSEPLLCFTISHLDKWFHGPLLLTPHPWTLAPNRARASPVGPVATVSCPPPMFCTRWRSRDSCYGRCTDASEVRHRNSGSCSKHSGNTKAMNPGNCSKYAGITN